ncbi:myozenin-2-like isoform X1 [Solea solea]|uniref:myozenin-2-like isoform X1 n=1 Tax=Solea solea TaxID=90069 RepID=UPI00272BAC80|nr:myozenin-2-like isoform X1 [Solea solea]XP_058505878.1 myozenin-2-like isoform X1 [Solea solea]
MLSSMNDKQRALHAKVLSKEAKRGGLNLGKKISVPKDVMMEELNLPSNRGSRMFQERQKRVERFTLENSGAYNTSDVHLEATPPPQIIPEPQGGKENQAFSIPGKHSLVMNLQKTVSKKGRPDVIAPGYTGPLKAIPHEKFNTTVIPKSYSSPWTEAMGSSEDLLNSLNIQLPQLPERPANYRCFNRSAMPFGGIMASKRVIPVIDFEAVESHNLPSIALERMCRRPNFNRAPKGWGVDYNPESNEL